MLHKTNDPQRIWTRVPPKRKRYPAERITSFLDRLDLRGVRFSLEQEKSLIEAIEGLEPAKSATHLRLFVILAFETAGKLAELSNCGWEDFDFDRKMWKVAVAGAVVRETPLSYRAMDALKELKAVAHPTKQRLFHVYRSHLCIGKALRQAALTVFPEGYHYNMIRKESISRMVERRSTVPLEELIKQVGAFRGEAPMVQKAKFQH